MAHSYPVIHRPTLAGREMFRMTEPFAFEIDPAALLDDEA
jgi:hypothetical protein